VERKRVMICLVIIMVLIYFRYEPREIIVAFFLR